MRTQAVINRSSEVSHAAEADGGNVDDEGDDDDEGDGGNGGGLSVSEATCSPQA